MVKTHTEVVEAITRLDTDIEHITRALESKRALRRSYTAELERLAPQPAPEPERAPAPPVEPTPPPASTLDVQPLYTMITSDGFRYERVLLKATDIPVHRYGVMLLLSEEVPEAHLGDRSLPFLGTATCGRERPQFDWSEARVGEMDIRVELCRACAVRIPGVRQAL